MTGKSLIPFLLLLPRYDDRECIWLEYGAMNTLTPCWFSASGHGAVDDVNSRYLIYYTSELHAIFAALFTRLARTLLTSGSQMTCNNLFH